MNPLIIYVLGIKFNAVVIVGRHIFSTRILDRPSIFLIFLRVKVFKLWL